MLNDTAWAAFAYAAQPVHQLMLVGSGQWECSRVLAKKSLTGRPPEIRTNIGAKDQ